MIKHNLLKLNIQMFAEETGNTETQTTEETQTNETTKNENVENTEAEQYEEYSEEEEQSNQKDKSFKNEQNKRNAERRRKEQSRKRELELSKARQEGEISGLGGINPYTNKEIKTDAQYKVYLDMKEAEKQGLNPETDMPEYYAQKYQKEQEAKALQDENEQKAQDNINDFETKYPDVDLSKLFADEDFKEFSDGKLDTLSLTKVYEQYLKMQSKIEAKAEQIALNKEARRNSTPGSAKTEGQNDDLYSLEQIKNLSAKEIDTNYDKVQKSLKALNIRY